MRCFFTATSVGLGNILAELLENSAGNYRAKRALWQLHLTLHSGTTHCQHFKEGSGASRQATAPLSSPQTIQRGHCPDLPCTRM